MQKEPFLVVEQAHDVAIAWALQKLRNLGLQTTVTFDLQVARHAHADCLCPYHGTGQCDCQMVVILVYGRDSRPLSLVVHSHEGRTLFSFVDTPQQGVNLQLESLLLHALTSPFGSSPQIDQTHVQ